MTRTRRKRRRAGTLRTDRERRPRLRDDPDMPPVRPTARALRESGPEAILQAVDEQPDKPGTRAMRGLLGYVERELETTVVTTDAAGRTVSTTQAQRLAEEYVKAGVDSPEGAIRVSEGIMRAQIASRDLDDDKPAVPLLIELRPRPQVGPDEPSQVRARLDRIDEDGANTTEN